MPDAESFSRLSQSASIKQWLFEKEAAKIMRISVHTLRAHRQRGTGLPYFKIGRSVRYSLADVMEFMEKHKISPAQ